MEPQSSLPDNELLVMDTSIIINLNATGCVNRILEALPHRVAVLDVVVGELEYGRSKGRSDATMLADLAKADLVTIASLDDTALIQFESLVVGASGDTLDDGEAATIAHAIATNSCALIDERKAKRICASRFPEMHLGCTLDIMSHQAVQLALGQPGLADALHRALLSARMRVPPHYMNWLINLIGYERAAACRCLPETVRQAARSA